MRTSALERILGCPQLPSLPAVALEVLELTRERNVDLRRITNVIRHDQALSTKVLRTVNSSYYGLSRPCTTIHQAIVYLGVNTMKTIVLGFSLADSFRRTGADDGFDFLAYWRRALFSSIAAKEIATAAGSLNAEEVFHAALVQDIGMIAMHRALGDTYLGTIDLVGSDHHELPAIEREEYDTDHAEVGAALMEHWRLPEVFVQSIRHHHREQEAPDEWRTVVRTVSLGSIAAGKLIAFDAERMLTTFCQLADRWFGFDRARVVQLLQSIDAEIEPLSAMLSRSIGDHLEMNDVLLTAERRQVQHQLEMEREAAELRASNRALTEQMLTDPLTGLANRARFDEVLVEQFDLAVQTGSSLGLILCDIDRFKTINDTRGHLVGDAALARVAAIVMETARAKGGLVARYGGEEIGIILPGMDRVAAAALAERIRRRVAERPISLPQMGDGVPPIGATMSVGVAVRDASVAALLPTPQLLLRVVDRALYAAKASGRNCVRVFAPAQARPSDAA